MHAFVSFLQYASGNVDTVNSYVPAILEYIVDVDALTDEIYMLPSTFAEEDMDNPFVFMEFWLPSIMFVLLFTFVIIPCSIIKYFLRHYCFRTKCSKKILDSILYNPILRWLIETYMDLIILSLINIPNVSPCSAHHVAQSQEHQLWNRIDSLGCSHRFGYHASSSVDAHHHQ